MIGCIGDILLDIFLLSELQEAEQGSGIVLRAGGSAANTAAWLARLGQTVSFVGCVGRDPLGGMLRDELAGRGIDIRLRAVAGAESGAVVIRVEEGGVERVMRSSRGANMDLSPADIETAFGLELEWLHVTGYSLLGPYGLDLLECAGRVARAAGAPLSFDPSSTGVIRRFGVGQLRSAINRVGVRVLLPNAEEARELAGAEDVCLAASLLTKCVPTVLVKEGPLGATYAGPCAPGHVAVDPITPVDPTGAGDAFNAGAIASLVARGSIAIACSAGCTVARETLSHFGGR